SAAGVLITGLAGPAIQPHSLRHVGTSQYAGFVNLAEHAACLRGAGAAACVKQAGGKHEIAVLAGNGRRPGAREAGVGYPARAGQFEIAKGGRNVVEARRRSVPRGFTDMELSQLMTRGSDPATAGKAEKARGLGEILRGA